MRSFGLTDRGKVRAENQDSFVIEYIDSRECLCAVLCDGMGGASAGSIASTLASKTFMNYLVDRIMASRAKNPDIKRHMNNACRKANDIVYSYSCFNPDYAGMGTTLVAASIIGNNAVIANVGDSRAYVISKKKIVQLTKDHSYVQELVDRGIITPERAKTHPKKNVILQALGSEDGVRCDFFVHKLARGERILLCSDGLTNMVDDHTIYETAMSNKSPEAFCKKLIELALEAGANDNVTVVTLSRQYIYSQTLGWRNSMDNLKLLNTMLDDRYDMQEVIGIGGMAVIYKALDTRLNRYVAIKVLKEEYAADPSLYADFTSESQAVAMLSHPNIVAVYDVSSSDTANYIVMELIEGITLKQYITRRGALSWKEALHFASQIARALTHAHEKGIIHRDIKPQNVMILKDANIKVSDFGIASLENTKKEAEGQAVGSVHYIAPEQAKGYPADARSDVYSLGVVMYEMLTGSQPYDGNTPQEIAIKHITGDYIMPRKLRPDIPEELERITLKAMNADIDKRYANAASLLRDLEAYRQRMLAMESISQTHEFPAIQMPVVQKGPTEEQYQRRRARAKRVSILSGVLGVLLVIVALCMFLWNYWLCDLFKEAERVDIPQFVGESYESVINNSAYSSIYHFRVTYKVDTSLPEGQIIAQDPEVGKSMVADVDGINVNLTVCTGVMIQQIPDVSGLTYKDANLKLQQAGFLVELEPRSSETIAKDYVIGTNPSANESLATGSTVYLAYSTGPEVQLVTVRNLVGYTEAEAKNAISNMGLSFGSSSYVYNENYDAGQVVWQSAEAGTRVEAGTKVYLQISKGPRVQFIEGEVIGDGAVSDEGGAW